MDLQCLLDSFKGLTRLPEAAIVRGQSGPEFRGLREELCGMREGRYKREGITGSSLCASEGDPRPGIGGIGSRRVFEAGPSRDVLSLPQEDFAVQDAAGARGRISFQNGPGYVQSQLQIAGLEGAFAQGGEERWILLDDGFPMVEGFTGFPCVLEAGSKDPAGGGQPWIQEQGS
jgi:hypothetical protein